MRVSVGRARSANARNYGFAFDCLHANLLAMHERRMRLHCMNSSETQSCGRVLSFFVEDASRDDSGVMVEIITVPQTPRKDCRQRSGHPCHARKMRIVSHLFGTTFLNGHNQNHPGAQFNSLSLVEFNHVKWRNIGQVQVWTLIRSTNQSFPQIAESMTPVTIADCSCSREFLLHVSLLYI